MSGPELFIIRGNYCLENRNAPIVTRLEWSPGDKIRCKCPQAQTLRCSHRKLNRMLRDQFNFIHALIIRIDHNKLFFFNFLKVRLHNYHFSSFQELLLALAGAYSINNNQHLLVKASLQILQKYLGESGPIFFISNFPELCKSNGIVKFENFVIKIFTPTLRAFRDSCWSRSITTAQLGSRDI